MTPDRLRSALALVGWSQRALAARLGCDDRLVRRWVTGGAVIPPDVAGWMERLAVAHNDCPPPVDWRRRDLRPRPEVRDMKTLSDTDIKSELAHLDDRFWCPMQTTSVPMPDGTLVQVAWRASNPDDPEIETASILAPSGKCLNDHRAHPGVYDHVHYYLQFGPDVKPQGYLSPVRRALGPGTDELRELWAVVEKWRDKFELTCPESIFQRDEPQVETASIFAECVAVVGYGSYDEETDEYKSPSAL